jgi:YHS domain-containing protein
MLGCQTAALYFCSEAAFQEFAVTPRSEGGFAGFHRPADSNLQKRQPYQLPYDTRTVEGAYYFFCVSPLLAIEITCSVYTPRMWLHSQGT